MSKGKYSWGFDVESYMFGLKNPDGGIAWLHGDECPPGTKRHKAVDEVLSGVCGLLNGDDEWEDVEIYTTE